jgi:signal peptidase I
MRLSKIGSIVIKIALALMLIIVVVPIVMYVFPNSVGANHSYIVYSASMRPFMRSLDVILVSDVQPSEVQVDDVISYKVEENIVSHRVVKINFEDGVYYFKVKGDAVEQPDSGLVPSSEIIGRVSYVIPLSYFHSLYGYSFLVLTPIALLTTKQIIKIYKLSERKRPRRRRGWKALLLGRGGRRRRSISILDLTSTLLLLILVSGSTRMMAPYITRGSLSFFSDFESAGVALFKAGPWIQPSTITCTVCPNPTVNLGENITVYGSINPARSGVDVKLTYEWNGTTITRAVTTNSTGVYQDTYKPNGLGVWKIKASWEGDNSYFGASSGIVTISVIEEE